MPGVPDSKVNSVQPVDGQYRMARAVSWAICIALAAVEAWTGQQYSDPDTIAYLDMSDGIVRNDWHTLINPYWSPLYPFFIGVVRWIGHPSPRWELPLTHLLNFIIFIAALTAFEFLMRQVIPILALPGSRPQSGLPLLERTYIWNLLGYSVFAWTTFCLVGSVRKSLPDLCVVAFIYLDAALVLRILSRQRTFTWFICLGATLGLGYYAKAILFPVGLLIMLVAVCAAGSLRKTWFPALAMAITFFSIAAPLVVLTSASAGRLTFGETGRLNYAWLVYGEPSAFYLSPQVDYRRDPPNVTHSDLTYVGDGLSIQRILLRNPDVFQLAPQGTATYPPWSDPALFASGLESPFHLNDQLRSIGKNLGRLITDEILPIPLTLAAYLVLFFAAARSPGRWRSILKVWPLFIVGIGGISLYTLIEILPRLVAGFAALAWLALLCGVRFQPPHRRPRMVNIAAAVFILSLAATAIGNVAYHVLRPPAPLRGAICEASVVASDLAKEGLVPGDVIAVIGGGERSMAIARFARARIDVAISWKDSSKFWQLSDPRARIDVYEALREGGARVVLSSGPPPASGFEEWRRIADTDFYVHSLDPSIHK